MTARRQALADLIDDRGERILRTALSLTALLLIGAIVAGHLGGQGGASRMAIRHLMLAVSVGALLALHSWGVGGAVRLFLFGSVAMLLGQAALVSGVRTPVLLAMPSLLVLSGWFLGRREAIALGAVAAIGVSAIGAFEALGLLRPQPRDVLDYLVTLLVVLPVSSVIGLHAHGRFVHQLGRAQEGAHRLERELDARERAEHDARARNEDLRLIHELSARVHPLQDVESILRVAIDAIVEVTRAGRVVTYLCEPDGVQLRLVARHDALTGLPNRAVLHEGFAQLDARIGAGARQAMMLLDLDRFKDINDTLGHHIGDRLLASLSQRLAAIVGSGDALTCRLGGDEFAVLLHHVESVDQALLRARAIRDALGQPFEVGGMGLKVGASIGVALYPDHGTDSHQLLRAADVAMYRSKTRSLGVSLYERSADTHSAALNLSARNLVDDRCVQDLERLIALHGLAYGDIELKITETAILHDPALVGRLLDRLDGQGVGLALDDFGTGYSSLAHLKRLPLDALKVDRSFVRDMTTDEQDAIIVRSTIALAHNLGMLVIAEGVEDADTEQLLRRMDCDMIQGYHVARPMPLDELIAWLAARERDPVPRPAAPDATHASRASARRPAGLPEYQ